MKTFTISSISRNESGQMYDAKPLAGEETFETVESAIATAVKNWSIGVTDILIQNETTGETVVGYVKSKNEFIEEFRGDWRAAKEILNEA